jgi:hypothetical protein
MRSGGAMVDLRKKKLSRKATILLLIVIMVSSVLSVLFGYLYINEVREEFYSTFGENAQFVANDIYLPFQKRTPIGIGRYA